MIRRMVKGGFQRKVGSFGYVLSNNDLLNKCKTESIMEFVKRQQRNYVAHIIRKDDTSISKRLLFNNNHTRKPGRKVSLYKSVIESEQFTREEFNTRAIKRIF